MTVVAFTVPGRPVGQNRNGSNRTRAYGKTPEQRQFAASLAMHGLRARRAAGWETTTAQVEVRIRVVFANERPDTDSPVKAVLDSLEVSRPKLRRLGAGFVANDRQVKRYVVERAIDPERPRVEIEVATC